MKTRGNRRIDKRIKESETRWRKRKVKHKKEMNGKLWKEGKEKGREGDARNGKEESEKR